MTQNRTVMMIIKGETNVDDVDVGADDVDRDASTVHETLRHVTI